MAYKLGQSAVQGVFFENPAVEFHIRQMARMLGMSKTAVSYHVKSLIKHGIVMERKDVFTKYAANEQSKKYRISKLFYGLEKVTGSGVVEHLEEKTRPKAVVLFGSFAKAEFDSSSDIDIFVQASEETIELNSFERKLKHKIHLLFEPKLEKLSSELLNNIINGIKLSGQLKLK